MGFRSVCLAPPFAPGRSGNAFVHATFSHLHPALAAEADVETALQRVAGQAEQHGLRLLLDITPNRIAADAPVRQQHPDWFTAGAQVLPDPRHPPPPQDVAIPASPWVDGLTEWWVDQAIRLLRAGIAGFCCRGLRNIPRPFWRDLIAASRAERSDACFIAWTPGLQTEALRRIDGVGFDRTCAAPTLWDLRSPWLLDEQAALQSVAPALTAPEPGFDNRLARHLPPDGNVALAYRVALAAAAAAGAGLFVPMGFEYATARRFDPISACPSDLDAAAAEAPVDLSSSIAAANMKVEQSKVPHRLRRVSSPTSRVVAWLRSAEADVRHADDVDVVLINPNLVHATSVDIGLRPLPSAAGGPFVVFDDEHAGRPLAPGEVRILSCRRTPDVAPLAEPPLDSSCAAGSRIAIETIEPVVTGGSFAAKTEVGRSVTVRADIIFDGHDLLAADLLWRPADQDDWARLPMRLEANDGWLAKITPDRVGLYEFAVEAWWDQWGSLVHDLTAKRSAGRDISLETIELAELLQHVSRRHCGGLMRDLGSDPTLEDLLLDSTAAAVRASGERPFVARSAIHNIRADRPGAAFASWYELFPRSVTSDSQVHGTFRDVISKLPDIQAMGFDVLYFPPIHPIGTVNRKGRNNSLPAKPGDVGSPYAIGSAAGGHDTVHPELGTIEDFDELVAAAHFRGLEIALDFAVQCAPDHPWLMQHHDWFRWRPDGSMRYAENPPKKYEDIVNPEFYGEASFPAVWTALRDAIQFWVDHGVRIFRVDNPHTKPLPFWQWMISDIQSRHPDVQFLAEAFTRPKLMYRLAKIGFSQSYTYFTWRNTKQELTEYLIELTTKPVADFFRPNFFVNTPDINPVFLQTSGRPGFLIRAVLATTLSGLWGMYSGFEICEAAPLRGREEYLDSEKYEIRPRDYSAAGNIVAEIAMLNRLRRLYPALQTHLGLRFFPAANDQILFYGKGDVLVAVSLDPQTPQEADIELPLWRLGLPDDAALPVTDLVRDHRFTWHGKIQRIRLDPTELPFHIWQLPASIP